MFRFAFGKLGGLLACYAACFALQPKEAHHRFGRRGTRRPCLVSRGGQPSTCRAGLVMGRPLLCLLPQICHRMAIRRIRWQGFCRAARALRCHNRVRRGAGVIPRALGAQQQRRRGVRHAHRSKRWGTVRGHPALHPRGAETSRAIGHGAQDLVALAPATRGALRLPATARPRSTPGTPRRPAGLLVTQAAPLATRSRPSNRRPLLLQPGEAWGRLEMSRPQPGRWQGQPHGVEQGPALLAVVAPPQLAPAAHSDASRVPPSRCTARSPIGRRSASASSCWDRRTTMGNS